MAYEALSLDYGGLEPLGFYDTVHCSDGIYNSHYAGWYYKKTAGFGAPSKNNAGVMSTAVRHAEGVIAKQQNGINIGLG